MAQRVTLQRLGLTTIATNHQVVIGKKLLEQATVRCGLISHQAKPVITANLVVAVMLIQVPGVTSLETTVKCAGLATPRRSIL